MCRLPAEDALELFLAGDQDGGIARTPRSEFAGDPAAGDALGGSNHLQDGEAAAVAHVESLAGNAVDLLKRANVGIGDVQHMDVIANTSAIGSGIVRSEDIHVREDAGGSIQNAWDEVSLDAMMLAAFLRSASSVKIAERRVREPGVELIVRENLFEYELRFSVRIDGRLAMVFRDGNDFRFAIGGRGGRKNNFFYAMAGDGVEQVHATGDVGRVENTGLAYGFGDQGLGSEVHYGVNLVLGENAFKLRAIGKIDLAKDSARRHGGAMALEQTVQCDDMHAARKQDFATDTADVSCGPGHENIHVVRLLTGASEDLQRCRNH